MSTSKRYQILSTQIWIDVYRLLGTVATAKYLADEALGDRDFTALSELSELFERSEIARLLVAIAALCRTLLDSNPNLSPEYAREPDFVVGSLIVDTNVSDASVPLLLREACNKILHAKDIDYVSTASMVTGKQHLSALVTLTGEKNSRPWRASIDIVRFAESATAFL